MNCPEGRHERSVRCPSRKRALSLFFLLALFLVSLVVPSSVFCEAAPSPPEVIERFNATLLEAMQKANELRYEGRYKLLEPVIRDSFAFPYMGSVSAGRYWKVLDDKQRSVYLETYMSWTVATYAGRFNEYAGERFELGPASGQGTVTVVSKLVGTDGDVTEFDYQLRRLEGRWRIVDIQISGVSQLALTRAQFVSVLKDKGFDGLVSMLKDRIRRFSRGEEK